MLPSPDRLDRAAEAIQAAQSVLFITGAGLSADSGLPTYRGVGGLYDNRETEEGFPIEEALSAGMFRDHPALTWRHIHTIEAACRGAQPNDGHRFIAALERRLSRVWTLTQNVDGLHQAAGARNIIEIHGTIHDLACTACPWTRRVTDYRDLPPLPRCPDCQAVVRPGVVLFEEMLPSAAIERLQDELSTGFDLVLSIGTSNLFPYISAPVLHLGRQGATTIEINPDETDLSARVTHRLQGGAAATLAALAARLSPPLSL